MADAGVAPPLSKALFLLIALLGATLFLQPIAERTLHPAVAPVISWPASTHGGQKDDSQLYFSCGTGFWGPALRLGAPAEITEFTLRRA